MMTLSIVTKTYNRCAFLQECIESVQKIKNEPYNNDIHWEHIVYDDGSEDETPDFCKTHPYPHVHYIRSEDNGGEAKAGNNAIKNCDSEWIFELDSDDFVPSRVLVNWYEAHLRSPDTDWFVMDFYRVDAAGKYEVGNDYYGWKYETPKAMLEAIFRGDHFIQRNVFYRKKLWQEARGYRENLNMAVDLDLFIRFLLAGHMPMYLPTISHFHRFHANNLSAGMTLEKHKKDLKEFVKIYKNQLEDVGVFVDL